MNKWKFYPIAVTILIPKLIIMMVPILLCVISIPLIYFGYDGKKQDHPEGIRRKIVNSLISSLSWLMINIPGVKAIHIYKDYDYSYYLGPNYKQT